MSGSGRKFSSKWDSRDEPEFSPESKACLFVFVFVFQYARYSSSLHKFISEKHFFRKLVQSLSNCSVGGALQVLLIAIIQGGPIWKEIIS